jgi:hyperosmotically inducible periplasmic protein
MRRLPTLLCAALIGSSSLFMLGCQSSATSRSTGEYVDDATITARVKTALINDPTVKARDIDVETFRGVVQLSGFVDSSQVAARAVDIAGRVGGVRSVKNDMRVKSGS